MPSLETLSENEGCFKDVKVQVVIYMKTKYSGPVTPGVPVRAINNQGFFKNRKKKLVSVFLCMHVNSYNDFLITRRFVLKFGSPVFVSFVPNSHRVTSKFFQQVMSTTIMSYIGKKRRHVKSYDTCHLDIITDKREYCDKKPPGLKLMYEADNSQKSLLLERITIRRSL